MCWMTPAGGGGRQRRTARSGRLDLIEYAGVLGRKHLRVARVSGFAAARALAVEKGIGVALRES